MVLGSFAPVGWPFAPKMRGSATNAFKNRRWAAHLGRVGNSLIPQFITRFRGCGSDLIPNDEIHAPPVPRRRRLPGTAAPRRRRRQFRALLEPAGVGHD